MKLSNDMSISTDDPRNRARSSIIDDTRVVLRASFTFVELNRFANVDRSYAMVNLTFEQRVFTSNVTTTLVLLLRTG